MRGSAGLITGALVVAMTTSCADESHDLQVQALGAETPGVAPGPLHRPGQPCLVCHGAEGPSSHLFVIAGTVYGARGEPGASVGAGVTVGDVNGSFYTATTNGAGNFYILPDQWTPTFPLQVEVTKGTETRQMLTYVARDGSCADCHASPVGPTSPGPVYVSADPSMGGGS